MNRFNKDTHKFGKSKNPRKFIKQILINEKCERCKKECENHCEIDEDKKNI